MKKSELIETIIEESDIHHNIRIDFNSLNNISEEQIDNETYDAIIHSTSESLTEIFKQNWETNHTGEVFTCGRMGATFYWDAYWSERQGHLSGFFHSENDLQEFDVSELKRTLKDIREFNKAVENLMEDFYSNVNDEVTRQIEKKAKQDKQDKLYRKTLKLIKKNDFTKRLFYDLIYKKL